MVEAFEPQIEEALENPVDFKSVLQERLARAAEVVDYRIDDRGRPAARPLASSRSPRSTARRSAAATGKTKKAAEQEAAERALERLERRTRDG